MSFTHNVPNRKPVPNRTSTSYSSADLSRAPSYPPPLPPSKYSPPQAPASPSSSSSSSPAPPHYQTYPQASPRPSPHQPFIRAHHDSIPTLAPTASNPEDYFQTFNLTYNAPLSSDSGYCTPATLNPPFASPESSVISTTLKRHRPVSSQYSRPAYSPGQKIESDAAVRKSWQRKLISAGSFPGPIAVGSEVGRFRERPEEVWSPYEKVNMQTMPPDASGEKNKVPAPLVQPEMNAVEKEEKVVMDDAGLPSLLLPPVAAGVVEKVRDVMLPLNSQRGLDVLEEDKTTGDGDGDDDARSDFSFQPGRENPDVVVTGAGEEGSAINGKEEESKNEDEDPNIYPDFRPWVPFREFYFDSISEEEHERINSLCARLFHEKHWENKAKLAIKIMKPILDHGEEEYSIRRIVEAEIKRIFEEAERFPDDKDFLPTRYIKDPDLKVGGKKKRSLGGDDEGGGKRTDRDGKKEEDEEEEGEEPQDCDHDDEYCSCWFDTTPDAGILGFPVKSRYRRAILEFIHNFMSELLMRLMEWTEERDQEFCDQKGPWECEMLCPNQFETLEEVLCAAGGDQVWVFGEWEEDSDSDDDEVVTNDRYDYLFENTRCKKVARGDLMEDEEEEGDASDDESHDSDAEESDGDETNNPEIPDPVQEENQIVTNDDKQDGKEEEERPFVPTQKNLNHMRLLGTLGSRLLALSICRWGKGASFVKREPVEYWSFGDMVREHETRSVFIHSDEYLARGRKEKTDQPRYPTRVINTETLEFETDPVVFKDRYAILSHVWEKDELNYAGAFTVFAVQKESQVSTRIDDLNVILTDLNRDLDKAREGGITPFIKIYDMENQIGNLESEIRLLKKELDALVKARQKKEREDLAKKLKSGFDLSRQPSKRVDRRLSRKGTRRGGPPVPLLGGDEKRLSVEVVQGKKEERTITQGEKKLMKAIQMARKLDFTYLWCDTVCINKNDAVEVNENISSMGDYYKNAHTCLIYLSDIDKESTAKVTQLGQIRNTKWSERGWTLQECVMSKRAKFFNHNWRLIFDSETEKRSKRIEQVCHIPRSLLWHGKKPDIAASVILSLSQKRKTTKSEDRAYSLMGILGVRMQVDYGEGPDKAIWRLLEHVIKESGDVSVFNWSGAYHGNKTPGRSLFPVDFSAYELPVASTNLDRPLRAHSEVTLGQSGVHARFEIWEPQIVFEDDNELSYNTICDLDQLVEQTSNHPRAHLDCEVKCRFIVDPNNPENDVEVTAYCPRSMLRSQLELQLKKSKDVESSWCLARFAGVKGSRWFLCLLKYGHSELSRKALFANMFDGAMEVEDDGKGGGMNEETTAELRTRGADRFVHYLEGMGFEGVRIPTKGFEEGQKKVPVEEARVVNLWVG